MRPQDRLVRANGDQKASAMALNIPPEYYNKLREENAKKLYSPDVSKLQKSFVQSRGVH